VVRSSPPRQASAQRLEPIIRLNATGTTVLKEFGRIPTTLTITYTFNGYPLTGGTAKITLKR
jgi:hypothetical protein